MSKPVNFSYSNNLISSQQPLINNKAHNNNNTPASSNAIMASLSRPNVNLGHNPKTSPEDNYNVAINFKGPFRKAYPMKHWRRQLSVNGKSGNGRALVSLAERPGGTVSKSYLSSSNCNCDSSGNNLFVTFDNKFLQSTSKSIKPAFTEPLSANTNNNKIQNNGFIQVGDPSLSSSYQIQTGVYETKKICSNPQKNNVIRSGSTLLSKSYYNDTKGYLKSRCKTFDQKQSLKEITGNTYNSKKMVENSTQFATNNCNYPNETNRVCQNVTYYNPNNSQFSKQGAVESSTRLLKLNNDTITKNGASFRSAFGDAAANAGKYHGESFAPYFLKSKVSAPIVWRRTGNKMVCTSSNCAMNKTLPSFWGSIK